MMFQPLKGLNFSAGANVAITVANGAVKVNNANVVSVDITTDNGVIHVIDSVLLPPVAVPATPAFDPKVLAGVSGPFGFFDPIGLSPNNEEQFSKYRYFYAELDKVKTYNSFIHDALFPQPENLKSSMAVLRCLLFWASLSASLDSASSVMRSVVLQSTNSSKPKVFPAHLLSDAFIV